MTEQTSLKGLQNSSSEKNEYPVDTTCQIAGNIKSYLEREPAEKLTSDKIIEDFLDRFEQDIYDACMERFNQRCRVIKSILDGDKTLLSNEALKWK